MRFSFPIANPKSKIYPSNGAKGSFWENRGDRYHCGVDFYAPINTDVLAVESGVVVETGVFTTSKDNSYWNTTYYVIVKLASDQVLKYAELSEINVEKGEDIIVGDAVGKVGAVLNNKLVDFSAPYYVQDLCKNNCISMLHLELHKFPYQPLNNYLGGNYFGKSQPDSLLNIEDYLNNIFAEIKE